MMNAYDPQLCTDPWRVVYMDHITKLPKTSRGNTAILVLIDAATHFALLFAVRSLGEEDVVYALSQMFAFVGAPTQFVTDHFKSFKAYGYRAFCKLTGSTPELAKANNSKSHGLVERANQEVLRHIGAFKSENFRYEWDTLLGLTNYVINDTISSLTGFPPRVLLFGSQHAKDTVNIRTLSEHEKTFHPKTVRNYLLSQDYIMARMYELVHDRLDEILSKRIQDAPEGFARQLTVGDIVLRRRPVKAKDFVRKYTGPYEVVGAKGDQVTLEWLATPPPGAHKRQVSHVNELKRFVGPDETHNPDFTISHASQGSRADVDAEKDDE